VTLRYYKYITLAFIISITFSFLACSNVQGDIKHIYVANSLVVDGNDDGNADGSIERPFNTIEQALVLASSLKSNSVNIWLREGRYFLSDSIKLSELDTRLAEYPLVISAFENEQVIVTGAKLLTDWNRLTDKEILANKENVANKLSADTQEHVYVTNLRDYKITKYGTFKAGGVELYYDDKKMQLARYPNSDLLTVNRLVEPDTKIVRSHKGSTTGQFYFEDNRITRWVNEPDIWLDGFWFWDWKDEIQAVETIDIKNKILSLKKPYHSYGYKKGQRYFAFNILSELDSPDEWYLDRDSGLLYFYPSGDLGSQKPAKLAVTDNLFEFNDVSNVTVKNITIAHATNNAIVIKGGSNNVLDNLVIKHIGNKAVSIKGSDFSKIINSHIFSIGSSAISINGGDRDTLTQANICAVNNKIHDYGKTKKTYQPGVSLSGVGNCAINNEIYDAPHIAVYFTGNDHVIEYNNIHHVVKESNDAGAIYAGRDWASRGTVIKYNYLHDIQGYMNKGAKGIYLDDEFSGTSITGNVFDNVYHAVFVGGGRDNLINNNIFINTNRSVYIDARGVGWAKSAIAQLTQKLKSIPYTSAVWKARYPELQNVLTIKPRLPVGNVVSNNVFFDRKWKAIFPAAEPYVLLSNNHEMFDEKPTKNYQLNKLVTGFENIPFDGIGVIKTFDLML